MSPEELADAGGWPVVLAELEANIRQARLPIGGDALDAVGIVADWHAPDDLGPIPLDLIDRARQILDEQRMSIGRLRLHRESIGRHLAVLRSIDAARRPSTAVYLDTTG